MKKQPVIPSQIFLETERLYLRELNPEVYKYLFTECNSSRIAEYLGLSTSKEVETEREKYNQGMETFYSTFLSFHILDKQRGNVLGKCGFHTWIPSHRRAEVGYELYADENKGKGYMTEALGAILKYGFEQMNLHRIEAYIASYNIPSAKLLQRFGFTQEGNARGHYVVNGVNEDSLLLSLLQPEYEQQKSSWGVKDQAIHNL
ncbi:GNAT family N-acetyltransferase [Pontibacter sp. KCTC 32443]|uniref:GNAT family N-acetyltransferase n=1 Tax=Pontibacter TaxID=323449 RepID=UPI00164D590D|nr:MULTISPECIES: GNAT family protein [Pontibacter]MBC5775103.1 GNAT family N-acetyltransferase [Pontibacter sp. KCTC 32443]